MPVSVELDESGKHIVIDAEWRMKELCKSIPGANWNSKDNIWKMPTSWSGCLALRGTFGESLQIGPKLTEWAAHEVATRIGPSNALREALDLDGAYPDLYPHQRAGVVWLSTARRGLLADEPGLGKALADSETVLTPDGFVPIGLLTVGDSVIGSNGQATPIVGVYPQGLRSIYRVTFSDGATADVDLDHLWEVENARTGFSRVVSTKWMMTKGLRRADGHRKFRIPMVHPVHFKSDASLHVDPYLVGLLVGDGDCDKYGRTRLTTSDQEIVEYVVAGGQPLTARGGYSYYLPGFGPKATTLEMRAKTASLKEIPTQYLRASVEDRISLLRGLMDSDGWVSQDGAVVQYTTVSSNLHLQMRDLIQSLGGIARSTYKPVPVGGNYPVFTLTVNTEFNPFRLPRKANLWVPRRKYPARRYVDSIEYLREESATCIKVAAHDQLFVMHDYIVTHNTAQAIRALAYMLQQGENPFPVLVVCPNTLKKNWEREFAKWWPGIRVQVIGGSAVQRRKQFDNYLNPGEGDPKPHVIVINWESLRSHSRLAPYGSIALTRCPEHGGEDEKVTAARCEVHERELNKIEFGAVIADEIHRSKDPKSKQTRALWAATGDADVRFALTGTPIAKDVLDLWSILHWLQPEEWPTKSRWIDRMVDTMMNAFGGMQVLGVKPQMQGEFFAAINPRMRRMLKQVVLPNLPPIINEQRFVEMSPKQKKAYTQMRDHMITELESGDYLMAPSPLTQMTRLLQFSSAYAELGEDPATGETHAVLSEPSASLDALMDDLTGGDFGNDSVAISAVSSQLLNLLSARLTKAKIPHGMITGDIHPNDRDRAIDDFQNGRTKVILFTVQAGGVGVTLTAARWLLRLQRPWSLVDDKQANDRVHRIGSEIHDSIVIVDYLVEGTVQERVNEVLEAKGENAEEIMKDRAMILRVMREDKEGR